MSHARWPLLAVGILLAAGACTLGPDPHTEPGSFAAGGDEPARSSAPFDANRRQLIGVRVAVVERGPIASPIELAGFVAPDETRLRPVQLRISGWVQQLHVSRLGEEVRAGDPLLTITSPELLQAELEFVIELEARGPVNPEAHAPEETHGARERLRLMDIPEDELRRLRLDRVAQGGFTARAPVSGVVVGRDIAVGQFARAGTTLITLADLTRVWVLADVHEEDFGRVQVGDRVTFKSDALPGRDLPGRIEFVYPALSNQTRTLRVRIPLANPDGTLRPGMYGWVQVVGRGGAVLSVPAEAVVSSGDEEYVFLPRADGRLEPRRVGTGARHADRVQILRGLSEGDTVVASAAFLIDSESRLKAAIAGMGKPADAGRRH
jgi:Cu(I)/Ag(I) efflux system membrane fusion protein